MEENKKEMDGMEWKKRGKKGKRREKGRRNEESGEGEGEEKGSENGWKENEKGFQRKWRRRGKKGGDSIGSEWKESKGEDVACIHALLYPTTNLSPKSSADMCIGLSLMLIPFILLILSS